MESDSLNAISRGPWNFQYYSMKLIMASTMEVVFQHAFQSTNEGVG